MNDKNATVLITYNIKTKSYRIMCVLQFVIKY